ncbi:lipopolysaccharide biosynthesis protein [Zhenpiania hominis]|uniref:Oligosaccharide flippase family protein n=1 Tax=Zhenpiania hominis TaxID=2763644 RepID=A0A923SQF2_9FIRM|nr:oligosaccharide flippase family protein [Zhenpiania hominis]MBC6679572.1 oligosaccharide flippase family protein [Zhenpiania hominis]
MSKTSNLVKNTLMLSIGTALSKGIQFILVIFVSRWLSTEIYGTFDVLCTYITLLLPILSISTGEAVFRFSVSSKTQKEQSGYITNGFVLVTCNLIICIGVLAVLSGVKLLSAKLVLQFLFLLGTQLFNYYLQAFLRAIKRLNIYTISNIISAFMIAFCSVLFIRVLQFRMDGLIYAYSIGYMVANLLIIFSARLWNYITLKTISRKIVKQLVHYSLPLVPNDISWWILNVSDRQVISIALGAAANGIYAIANKLPALCNSIFGMFSVSWQQSMAEKIEMENWQEYANQVYNQMTVVLLTLCSGILSVTFIFFNYMFDIKYYSGMVYVPILLTATIFSSWMLFFGGVQIALKKTSENGVTTVIGAIINLIINIALIHFIGLYAAAISTLVANIITAVLRRHRLKWFVRFWSDSKTRSCWIIYGYFIVSFYFFQEYIVLEWINILLAGIAFIAVNHQFLQAFFRR